MQQRCYYQVQRQNCHHLLTRTLHQYHHNHLVVVDSIAAQGLVASIAVQGLVISIAQGLVPELVVHITIGGQAAEVVD